ncbi:PQQ-binding-like beta-propeller repeat protein [Actinoplanes sp. NPDC051859]|uniref:outer membrane protein assembly factor BamB family protein n=1 Tax=Actinoplanes sp. NPDC051859 TaxID=3363909 RepID=UPI003794A0E9
MALIELSTEPLLQPPASPPPAYVYRRLGLLLVLILVFVLGGAAPASSLHWEHVGDVPFAAGTEMALVGDRVVTVDGNSARPTVRGWSIEPVRELWDVPVPPTDADWPYAVYPLSADLVLLGGKDNYLVLDARTGETRWTATEYIQPLGNRIGLVQREEFRPGTEYDPSSGNPGQLFGLGDSKHTEPAQRTTLAGIELATGRQLWTATEPGSIVAEWSREPRGALVVLAAGRLVERSAETGAVVHERALPKVNGALPQWVEVDGSSVLVHYDGYGEGGTIAAYALGGFAPLWTGEQPDPQGSPGGCMLLWCQSSPTELIVLDSRTGQPLWSAGAEDQLFATGDDAVLVSQSEARPVRLADRQTGSTRADLSAWLTFTGSWNQGTTLLLSRLEHGGDKALGVLRPDASAVQPLGRISGIVGDCQLGDRYVACMVEKGATVYRYQP